MNFQFGIDKSQFEQMSAARQLKVLRIIWAALLAGQIAFLIVVLVMPPMRGTVPRRVLALVHALMFVTVVPGTYMVRRWLFARDSVDGKVRASTYSNGNIIFWAGCEGTVFAGLGFGMISGSLWPMIVLMLAAMALQVMTFPISGKIRG